jgi:putative acetyltransferase
MPGIDFEARRAWFETRLHDLHLEGAHLLGVFEADVLLGFITVNPMNGDIDQLCVARRAQGRGLAARLIAAARRLSPQGLELTVNLDNDRALRVYERAGFVRGAQGTNPMSGLPTVRMRWRPIPPP